MKATFENIATAVLASCALIVTGLVVHREVATSPPDRSVTVSDWRQYAVRGHVLGSPHAPVTIVVFSDFQCPGCRALAHSLQVLRKRHPRQFSVVYRQFPLPGHRYAARAADASECAARQGRFEAYHNVLFAQQTSIGRVPWTHFAIAAGVPDTTAFAHCTASGGAVAVWSRDTADGHRLGVYATPTVLINDVEVTGAPPLRSLDRMIERAAKRADTE